MEGQDYCSSLETIPQFSGTCWFNSILHVMLYSQGLRKAIWKSLKPMYEKNKTDKFYKFLIFMLNNYNDIEKLEKIYSSFKNLKLKPEYLLGIFLKKHNMELYKIFMETDKLDKGHYQTFIMNILYAYDIKYFHFHYSKTENETYMSINESFYNSVNRDTNSYLNANKDDTDILIITSEDGLFEKTKAVKIDNQKIFRDVVSYNKTIDVNGTIYKLDSCLLTNHNIRHAVALIKCNDNNYFIDSSAANYRDNYKLLSNKKKQRFTTNMCKPVKFDWTDLKHLGDDFTFTVNDSNQCAITYDSSIDGKVEYKSVYNIYNNNPIFIYVKDVEEKSKFSRDLSFSSIKSKEILKDFNLLSLSELEKYIDDFIYVDDEKFIIYTNDMKRNFSYFYKKLLRKYLNPYTHNDILKKEFLIAIIKKHILKGNVYKYEVFLDTYVIKEEIIQLKTFNNQELLNKLDIKRDIRDIEDMDFGLLYEVLFTENKSVYDKYLLSLMNDDFASMLIKMIIEKKFYRNNYIPVFNKVIRESYKTLRTRSRSK